MLQFIQLAPIFSSIIGLAAYCVSHVLVARLYPLRSPYFSLIGGIGVGFICTVVTDIAAMSMSDVGMLDRISIVLMNIVAYLGLAFGYFNFVNLTIASLRIRLLEELLEAGGNFPRQRLIETYGVRAVGNLRLERLVKGGHLNEQNGKFYGGHRRFLYVGRFFQLLRRLILGPINGVN